MAAVGVALANLAPEIAPGQVLNRNGSQLSMKMRRAAFHAAEYSTEAIDELAKMMRGEDRTVTGMAKVRATEILLDRGLGKASDGLALMLAEEATSASVEVGVRFVMGSRRVEFTEEAALPVIEQPPNAETGPSGTAPGR